MALPASAAASAAKSETKVDGKAELKHTCLLADATSVKDFDTNRSSGAATFIGEGAYGEVHIGWLKGADPPEAYALKRFHSQYGLSSEGRDKDRKSSENELDTGVAVGKQRYDIAGAIVAVPAAGDGKGDSKSSEATEGVSELKRKTGFAVFCDNWWRNNCLLRMHKTVDDDESYSVLGKALVYELCDGDIRKWRTVQQARPVSVLASCILLLSLCSVHCSRNRTCWSWRSACSVRL
jgi:hypothetical protein